MVVDIPCPGGIPPWGNPPENGEYLAYEGWTEWVEENGNFTQRMQLVGYRFETATQSFAAALLGAKRNLVNSVNKFIHDLQQSS